MALSVKDINRKHTNSWTRCNDDSKSNYYRNIFISQHGGSFRRKGQYWEWIPDLEVIAPQMDIPPTLIVPPPSETIDTEQSKTFVFMDTNDVVYKIKNIQRFCREHNLNRRMVYQLIKDKRKPHKGFRFIEMVID